MIEVRPLKFRGLLFGVYFFAIVQRKYIRKCKSMGNLYCHKSMEKQEKKIWRKRIAKQESYEVHMENEFQSFACCCSLGYILYNPARADV